jgi:hypothetical protein
MKVRDVIDFENKVFNIEALKETAKKFTCYQEDVRYSLDMALEYFRQCERLYAEKGEFQIKEVSCISSS